MNQELIEIFNEIGDPLLGDGRDRVCEALSAKGILCAEVECKNCLLRIAENSWYKTIKVIHEQTKQEESQ